MCAAQVLSGLVLLAVVLSLIQPVPASAQTPEPDVPVPTADDVWAEETLASMTVADKIGQLFLVTFSGNEVDAVSDIARLVQTHRVGGVLISPENENFANDSDLTATEVLSLTTALQGLAFAESAPVTVTLSVPVTTVVPLEDTRCRQGPNS